MMNELNVDIKDVVSECGYSDEDKIRAAYALNMCMVSVSQIIDYDDLNVLEQEYEGILNNLNLEMMPKDEALLTIIKRLLDTITFFRIQEEDKKLLAKEYQQKMKNAIWSAVPNFGLIVAGGNPVTMAVSLASQVGIGYMNYRRTKSENNLEYEKKQWQLQRSAMEQFNGLRRELFDTAWRLADTYKFPDSYRLTERQIKQYDDILMDSDEIRKYERLTTIKDCFRAYPPFWYFYGSTANHIARNATLSLSDESRYEYQKEALDSFEQYWISNKFALLREDHIASACALEHIDLLDISKDRAQIEDLLDKAIKYSGNANDILQLCAIAYLRIGNNGKAADIFRILVNEEYNTIVNAQILSGIYVNRVLYYDDHVARAKYEILTTRINPDYLLTLPAIGETASEDDLENDFAERQEELLKSKFSAVIRYCVRNLSIRLGKIVPASNSKETVPDYYYSEEGFQHRIEELQELFNSKYKARKRKEYLDCLAQCGFINAYFKELNQFFGEISELNCIRDRQRLQEVVAKQISGNADRINQLTKKIEERNVSYEDMCQLLTFTSTTFFESFVKALENQINTTIIGMCDMGKYAAADSALRSFCNDHGIPEPDILLSDGNDAKPDNEIIDNYFGFDLLGQDGESLLINQKRYRKIEEIIKKHQGEMKKISEKALVYLHDSQEFNSYFESSKLKKHKDILQNTIAIYDDKSFGNADVLFTVDGLVPIIRGSIKTTIPYLAIAGENVQKQIYELTKSVVNMDAKTIGALLAANALVPGLPYLASGVTATIDTHSINKIVVALQPMIDEICEVILLDVKDFV